MLIVQRTLTKVCFVVWVMFYCWFLFPDPENSRYTIYVSVNSLAWIKWNAKSIWNRSWDLIIALSRFLTVSPLGSIISNSCQSVYDNILLYFVYYLFCWTQRWPVLLSLLYESPYLGRRSLVGCACLFDLWPQLFNGLYCFLLQ